MRNVAAAASIVCLLSASALAAIQPFPANFGTLNVVTNDTQIYVRAGGEGPAVLLLHGYGETGDMWAPLAARLARNHKVIVPDLRGLGLSSRPAGGYDKKTQAEDMAGVLDALKIDKVDLVTHDIGNMVGYAFCRAVSAARVKMGRDGTAGDRPPGPPVEIPEGLALQLPWPRRRAAGSRTRANPARPLLQRAFSQPVARVCSSMRG